MLLDEFMPIYEFSESHSIEIGAGPAEIFRSIREVTPMEIPLLRALFGIRSLPSRLAGKGRLGFANTQPFLEQILAFGFTILGEDQDRELVLGTIGQFWKLWGGSSPQIDNSQDFLGFDKTGYAKATINFYVEESPSHGKTLNTQTRIYIPDPGARRKFAIYWRLIYPGSALIRRMWLGAIKRRAEKL